MSDLIYVVDGDTESHSGIDDLLRACGYRTKAYGSTDEILEQMPERDSAGCIVIDVQRRDNAAPDLFDRLSKAGSNLPVIFLAEHSDVRAGVRAIKAGAEDFFTKPVPCEEFIGAIARAIARHRLTNEQDSWLQDAMARLKMLTRRERQVFDLVVRAKMNKQVAFELGTTERTVKAHRHNLMEKMQLRSVVELVSCAERLGLLKPSSI
ncbi:response regulator transcription factor [Bosea sp. NBC_00550]|uniref:response regulator transcription factor n=1 Tax=Bosea sp. NBC_00550 TaxID=2969621 RepID=UPI002231C32E|nr:LuxR C-terminal-related transcriptional regulator [Bosea sp. NBC_00550]UZF93765.1 LuxR C-terminal-related transcriptional regulator [Bosea sp. NBC_00550]